jgi:hypothetical protein
MGGRQMLGAEKAVDREKHHSVRKLAKLCGLSPSTIRPLLALRANISETGLVLLINEQ